jgi:hypothetical protein
VGIEPTTFGIDIGSIPTVARHIFQACPVWIYTQSNIRTHKHASYSPEYITPTQKKIMIIFAGHRRTIKEGSYTHDSISKY